MDRNEEITRIRPNRNGTSAPKGAKEFYDHTLKSVIQMQAPVLLSFLKRYAYRKSKHFSLYKTTEKVRFLKVLLRENELVHQSLYGIVHGVLTTDEIDFFFDHIESLEKAVLRDVEALIEKNTVML